MYKANNRIKVYIHIIYNDYHEKSTILCKISNKSLIFLETLFQKIPDNYTVIKSHFFTFFAYNRKRKFRLTKFRYF